MASEKVKIVLRNNSTFEGILHKYDEATGKLVLYDVSTEGVKLLGTHYFYKKELISLQYLNSGPTSSDETQLKKIENVKEAEKESPISEEKPCLTSFGEMMNLFKKSTPTPNCQVSEEPEQSISMLYKDVNGNSNDGNSKDEFEDFYETEDYIIINRLCDQFYEAIIEISGESIVGLQLDGVNLGRNGTLSVFQIATETKVYIFDIIRIGSKAFSEGLKLILENPKIMKVIHDSRFTSDMIHHKYKSSLNNIFDTQVASALVHRINNDGEWPEYVDNLPTCLMNHLNLASHQPTVSHESFQQNEEEALWLQRPLSKQLLTAVSINASYLIELHNVLLEKMLLEFRTGVQIYLNHVDTLAGEVEKSHKSKYRLPGEFVNFKHYLTFYNEKNRKNRNCLRRKSNSASNTSSSKQRIGPSIFQKLTSLKKSLTNSGMGYLDKTPDDSGCYKDDLKTCSQEMKRSNSLLSCSDADSVGDPFNTSLPLSETENQLQASSLPGRIDQFCENLQNLSLESDEVDAGPQVDRAFTNSRPVANKTGSSVSKSDDSSAIKEPCAKSFNVYGECCLSPIESPKNTVDVEVESSKNTVDVVVVESPKNTAELVVVDFPKNTVDVVRTIPAGLRDQNLKRKKKSPYDIEKSTKKDDSGLDTSSTTTDATEEEYGCIPMQHSLQRSELVVLGSRDLDLRNADVEVGQIADDVEGVLPKLSQEAEEKIEKIIKLISSRNIQSKILPCKLKLKS